MTRVRTSEKKLNVSVDSLPNPPPLSNDPNFDRAVDAIKSFKLSEISLTFTFCSVCKERRLNMPMASENMCQR